LCHAFSALGRETGFTRVTLTALAFAGGVNTLIFRIVDGVLLRPLPYPEPDRLVRVFEWTPRNPKFPLSIYNYLENRPAQNTLESSGYGWERRRGFREKSWWRLTLRKDNQSASPQTDSLTIRCDSTCLLVPAVSWPLR
jgi:hypothetical protein